MVTPPHRSIFQKRIFIQITLPIDRVMSCHQFWAPIAVTAPDSPHFMSCGRGTHGFHFLPNLTLVGFFSLNATRTACRYDRLWVAGPIGYEFPILIQVRASHCSSGQTIPSWVWNDWFSAVWQQVPRYPASVNFGAIAWWRKTGRPPPPVDSDVWWWYAISLIVLAAT